jgi:hypothetical protein
VSNTLTLATVTAALKQRLQAVVNATNVPSPTATTDRPDQREKKTGAGVNIFLYHVAPNPSLRNADVPTFSGGGDMVQRPRAALDLHYLLSFYGDETVLEPQRLVGAVVAELHARPTLTRDDIDGVVSPSSPPASTDPAFFLGASDLADEVDRVRFTPNPLSTEELSKLWSVLFQTPYSLSVAYRGSVAFVEIGGTPRPTLPVRERNLYVVPFRAPRLVRVVSAADPDLPVLATDPAVIVGTDLRGDVTRISLSGLQITPPAQDVATDRITFTPPPTVSAGVRAVQVTHEMMMGTPATAHSGPESNVVAVALAPRLKTVTASSIVPTGPTFSADIEVEAEPDLREGQRVELLLNHAGAGGGVRTELPPLAADTPMVTFPVTDLEPGPYYVRIRVDGAESTLLDVDPLSPTFKQFVLPQVTIP